MPQFRSIFERNLNDNLKSRGVKFTYETLELPYTLHCIYHPDFILSNGIIIEAKGRLLPTEKRKMITVKKQHPNLDIRFVFMYPDRKITGTKQTHTEWATKNGFKSAGERVPQEWIDE